MDLEMTHTDVKQNPLGFWEAIDKPSPEALQEFYAGQYYQTGHGYYRPDYPPDERRYMEAKIRQKSEQIRTIRGDAPGRMLDVGCGEGFALAFFRRKGWQVEGIDYTATAIEGMNPACRDAVTTGDIMALLADRVREGRRYDVIWMTNVLEHVVDPLGLLTTLGCMASPTGVLVITVPNDFSAYQLTLAESGHIDRPFWVSLPDHLVYFNRDSLQSAAAATGWACREILADFPIDWFLMHPGSNYVRDRARGKDAHQARILFENALDAQSPTDVNAFYSAMAKVGLGRQLTAFLTRPGEL